MAGMTEQAASRPSQPPVVVVVGAGPGLGGAVAHRFAGLGFRVGLVARSPERLDLTGLDRAGPPVTAAADVTVPATLRAALAEIADAAGPPEVLVYNASVYVAGPPTAMAYEAFVTGLASGAPGLLVAVQSVVGAMRERRTGTVLVTNSGAGLGPSVGAAGLAANKAALRNLALSLAAELRPEGVHVATVTIRGVLGSSPAFTPETVAAAYQELYEETATLPAEQWRSELAYTG
jgi:NADP-dependent 3-hydroxy acid dehydrogenase YdfG